MSDLVEIVPLCSWARFFTLTVFNSVHPGTYKWVSWNDGEIFKKLGGGWGYLHWTSIPSRESSKTTGGFIISKTKQLKLREHFPPWLQYSLTIEMGPFIQINILQGTLVMFLFLPHGIRSNDLYSQWIAFYKDVCTWNSIHTFCQKFNSSIQNFATVFHRDSDIRVSQFWNPQGKGPEIGDRSIVVWIMQNKTLRDSNQRLFRDYFLGKNNAP